MENKDNNSLNVREKIDMLSLSLSSPKERNRKKELENFRIDSAVKSLEVLKTENVGIIADTGTGKTPISFINILVRKIENKNYRVLFLVPRRSLAYQHEKLFHKVEWDGSTQTAIFIGGVKIKDRKWYDKRKQIIFATPQMFMNDVRRGIADIEFFDDIVMDEFHHAQGNYDYVKIAELAEQYHKKIIGLSASPGDTEEKINKLKKSSHISNFIRVDVSTPKKIENVVFAEPDEILISIEQHFFKLFSAVEKRLEQNGIFLKRRREDLGQYLLNGTLSVLEKTLQYTTLKEKELKVIGKSIDIISDYEPRKWKALMWHAVYRKLKHAYTVCLMESYVTFLVYVEKLKKDETKASEKILASKVFQDIVSLAEKHKNEPPKILALIKNARHLYRLKMKTIIFIGEKVTGEYIKEIMNKKIPISDVIFGGQKIQRQFETIEKLKNEELMFLISTSVIDEGIDVSEVDAVVNYSIPTTTISRIQRGGRTARIETGNVIFILLNHVIDRALYWMTFRGEQNMKNLLKKMENCEESISQSAVTPDGKLLLGKDIFKNGIVSNEKLLTKRKIYPVKSCETGILPKAKLFNRARRCPGTLDLFQEKEISKPVISVKEEIKENIAEILVVEEIKSFLTTPETNCSLHTKNVKKKNTFSFLLFVWYFLQKIFRL
ncbi:MAG: fanconi anemia group M protein [Parcubacteria group bacterium Athens0714_16]|nr:MAG: fanconi anemia group M protein [Parcubacteria group bacterium Athens0714_16]